MRDYDKLNDSEKVAHLEAILGTLSSHLPSMRQNSIRLLIKELPIYLALCDEQLRYEAVSDLWIRLFRLPYGSIGSAISDTIPQINWQEVFRKSHSAGHFHEENVQIRISGRREELAKFTISPRHDSQGRRCGLIVIISLITEEERQKEVLARTQRLASVGGWEYDLISNKLWWSDEVYRIHKVETLPKIGAAIHFYTPEHRPIIQDAIDTCRETGKGWDLELCLINALGEKVWVRTQGNPVWENGKIVKLIGAFQDISTRYLAQKTAQLEKERFELALRSGDLGLWDWNVLTNECFFNDRWYTMLGYEPLEYPACFETWELLIHPDDFDFATEQLRSYFEGRLPSYELEFRMKTKSGDWKWIFTRGKIVERDSQGNPARAVGTHLDITEHKQSQAALLRAKELAESANQAKSQFLANMSHELRTPLNGVLGMAQALNETSLQPDQRLMTQTILESADLLLSLINDILDLSKLRVNKFELHPEPVNLRELTDSLERMFTSRMKQAGLVFKVDQTALAGTLIAADPNRIKQVLINLLGNALKFTPKGGSVLLRVSSTLSDPGLLTTCFSVEDNGIGIPKHRQRDIFSAFSQGDSQVGREFGGTGLGLTISSQLVELMGGQLIVNSSEGKGSAFSFTLSFPLVESNLCRQDSRSLQIFPLSILVAEDNKTNQIVIQKLLEASGHSVTIVSDGRQACDAINAHDYDVVLMDIQMPVMDGVEASQRIKQSHSIPIIGLSAHAMLGDRERYLENGMDDYLTKPIKKLELLKSLKRILDNPD